MITDDTRILVLCTGNSCRSQMAEGFFRHHLNRRRLHRAAASLRSAGLEAHGVNPKAVLVMRELGIDISGHTSNDIQDYLGQTFDYVITVCDNAAKNCPVFPGDARRIHWPFDDPAGATGSEDEILEQFRRIRDQIGRQVESWIESGP